MKDKLKITAFQHTTQLTYLMAAIGSLRVNVVILCDYTTHYFKESLGSTSYIMA